jgi:hypothetical protein
MYHRRDLRYDLRTPVILVAYDRCTRPLPRHENLEARFAAISLRRRKALERLSVEKLKHMHAAGSKSQAASVRRS